MKIRFASVTAGAAVLATTGALLLAGAGAANAASPTPPWQPSTDVNQVGTLTMYNATGGVVTSGSVNDAPFAAYFVGSAADAAHTKATAYFATPVLGQNQSLWPNEQISLSTTYPNTTAPAPVNAAGTNPVVTGTSGDESLATYIDDFPNTDTSTGATASGYNGLYELRVKTGTSTYQALDVQVANITTDSGGLVTGGTWTQVYPAPAAALIGTTTVLASSANPSVQGSNVTFTATVSDADASTPSGTVTFTNGATTLCSAVVVAASKATCSTSTLPVTAGTTITAAFTPPAAFSPSSNTVNQVVQAPLTPTTTTLTTSGTATTGTNATLSGTVAPTAATGSVSFFDNGGATAIGTAPVTAGAYTFTLTGGFTAGSHSVVAKFTPDTTSAATYNGSQSAPQAFTTIKAGGTCAQTGSTCSDTQTIQGEVPAGTLVISTPYTAANALDVGTLVLNGAGTLFSGNATFKCITITDSNGANTGFVAQAAAGTLSKTAGPAAPAGTYGSIDGQNVGLTGLTPSPAASNCPNGFAPVNSFTGAPGSIGKTDNPAAPGVIPGSAGTLGLGGSIAHTILTGSANGVGTATYDGTLTLNAPTSTAPGTYTGTIVFTVSDGN